MPKLEAPAEASEVSNSQTSIIDSIPSSESDSATLSDYEVEININNLTSSSSESEVIPDSENPALAFKYEDLKLPLDFNLKQLLIRVTETEDLETVISLRLRVIARDFSLQRLPLFLPNLRELNLNGSCLMTLRDLGCDMQSLEILHVARTGLNSLDGLFGLSGLMELYVASNNIKNVCQCSALPSIRVLDIANNAIKDAGDVSFLKMCSTLKHLTLEGNPVATIENYRETVKKHLPYILSLDGQSYSDEATAVKIISRFPPIPTKSTEQETADILKNKRPLTTGSLLNKTNKEKIKLLPVRPSTARIAAPNEFSCIVSGSQLRLDDIRKMFIPSKLTCGKPLCGNPALGLWEKKYSQAWEDN